MHVPLSVRLALRSWGRQLPLILAVVLSVASATVAVIVGLNAVYPTMFRGLPFHEGTELVSVQQISTAGASMQLDANGIKAISALPRTSVTYLADVTQTSIVVGGLINNIAVARVSPNFLDVLGVRSDWVAIRGLSETLNNHIAVTHDFWAKYLLRDSSVIGKELTIGSDLMRIGMVLPPDFLFPWRGVGKPDVLIMDKSVDPILMSQGFAVARLDDRIDNVQLATDGTTLRLVSLQRELLSDYVASARIVMSGVALVALQMIATVVILVSIYHFSQSGRHRLLAIFGASPQDISRAWLAENSSLLLIGWGIGGGLGLYLTQYTGSHLTSISPIGQDGIPALVLILSGIAPLVAGFVTLLLHRYRSYWTITSFRFGQGLSQQYGIFTWLTGIHVLLTIVLLTVSVSLWRSLAPLLAIDLGFKTDGAIAIIPRLPEGLLVDRGLRWNYMTDALQRIRGLPSVTAAGGIDSFPLAAAVPERFINPDPNLDMNDRGSVWSVTTGYLETMGVKPISGRLLMESDSGGEVIGCVVTATTSVRLGLPGDPLNSILSFRDRSCRVVGIVPEMRASLDGVHQWGIYVPLTLDTFRRVTVVARLNRPIDEVTLVLPSVLGAGGIPVNVEVQRFDELALGAVSELRAQATLFERCSLVVLMLSLISAYAVVAHALFIKRRDNLVRLALGATRTALTIQCFWRLGVASTIGACGGIVAATLFQGVIESHIPNYSSLNPWATVVPAFLFLIVLVGLTAWLSSKVAVADLSELVRQGN